MKKGYRKFLSVILVVVFCIGLFTVPAMANEEVKVLVNGTELEFDVPPQLIDGRTMVPMRKIFEELGANVMWIEDTQTITAIKSDIIIIMQIDNTVIYINNEPLTLDVPPQLVEGRTLVPVRAVAEGLNADVQWEEETQTVIITKEDSALISEPN